MSEQPASRTQQAVTQQDVQLVACASLQIPCLVRMSKAALQEGKCVVIGLQSTGEARTADVVAERGEVLDDYVSGPRVSHPACVTATASALLLHVAVAAVSCAGGLSSQLVSAAWI